MIQTVTTEHSVYRIDHDNATLERRPVNVDASDLRGDNNPIPIIHIDHLRIGDRAAFLIDIRGDGTPTLRITTPVERIDDET